LSPHLDAADVPTLPDPDVESPTERLDAAAPLLQDQQAERDARIEKRARPSYQTDSVTREDHAPSGAGLTSESAAEGYGEGFGRVLHRLLEHCVQARRGDPVPDAAVVEATFRQEGAEATPEAVERAHRMLDRFLDSQLWTTLTSADPVYTEYPVAQTVPDDAGPFVRRGIIDMVYRTHGEWTLVDYKSDRVEGPLPDALPDDHPYIDQLQAYAEAWSSIVEEPIRQVSLWFADVGNEGSGLVSLSAHQWSATPDRVDE
jgi:ATP-dependent helicase/nuclease subunit A